MTSLLLTAVPRPHHGRAHATSAITNLLMNRTPRKNAEALRGVRVQRPRIERLGTPPSW